MPIIRGTTKDKILLLLGAGISLGLTITPRKQLWILRSIPKELRRIDQRSIRKALSDLERDGLIAITEHTDNTFSVVLSPHATQRLGAIEMHKVARKRPKKWDQKWRLLIYDVSEDRKKSRDAIRRELQSVGFLELQHSVWIFPFDVTDVMQLLRELYDLKEELIVLTTDRFESDERFISTFHLY